MIKAVIQLLDADIMNLKTKPDIVIGSSKNDINRLIYSPKNDFYKLNTKLDMTTQSWTSTEKRIADTTKEETKKRKNSANSISTHDRICIFFSTLTNRSPTSFLISNLAILSPALLNDWIATSSFVFSMWNSFLDDSIKFLSSFPDDSIPIFDDLITESSFALTIIMSVSRGKTKVRAAVEIVTVSDIESMSHLGL